MTSEERAPLPLSEHRNQSATSSSPASVDGGGGGASELKPKPSWTMLLAAGGAVLGSSFQFGYNNSVINTPAALIKDWINATSAADGYGADRVTLLFSIVVSIWAIGGLIGGLSAGYFADRFGRRRAMLANNAVAVFAAVLMAVAKPAGSVVPLIIGRFVSGLNCGANTVFPTMYLSEISPRHLRGAFGVVHQLNVVIGILISQVVGLPDLFGRPSLWPWALGLSALPALIQPLLFLKAPESPRFLLINRKDAAAATDSLKRLRGGGGGGGGGGEVESDSLLSVELREMEEESAQEARQPRVGLGGVLSSPILRQPMAIAVVLHLAQQLCGINAIFYYSTELFKSVGLDAADASLASVGTSGLLVVATLVSVPLMEKAGRRTLMLVGLGLIIVFEIVLTVTLSVGRSGGGVEGTTTAATAMMMMATTEAPLLASSDSISGAYRYVGVASIVATVAAFAIGPGSIPWFFPAEIFPQGARGVGMSFGCGVNWLANFVVGISFEHLQKAAGGLCFLPFIAVASLCWGFAAAKMPETMNKTFDEIQAVFLRRAGRAEAEVEEAGL